MPYPPATATSLRNQEQAAAVQPPLRVPSSTSSRVEVLFPPCGVFVHLIGLSSQKIGVDGAAHQNSRKIESPCLLLEVLRFSACV
jgi:hypothetical protein